MNTPWIKGEPKEWEAGDYFLAWLSVADEPILLNADEDTLRYVDQYGTTDETCTETIAAHMPVTPYTETE